jgi:hypothetical protein
MYANNDSRLKAELARLTRNVERREGREKAKGLHVASIPGTPGAGAANGVKATGSTPRKCAGCGEVGHIKTNKKSVLLLSCAFHVESHCFFLSLIRACLLTLSNRMCPLLNGQKKQSDTFRDASGAGAGGAGPASSAPGTPLTAGSPSGGFAPF